jgi:hypothetical protein
MGENFSDKIAPSLYGRVVFCHGILHFVNQVLSPASDTGEHPQPLG